ncbi:hypothetical protein LP420_12005 [Massilia sp. B-10]|nr:hypothetical protein LP420_12005 [Massilia sp. B-10]
MSTLQVVTEGGTDYQPGSAPGIHDNKIEQFNFGALVAPTMPCGRPTRP